MSMKPVGWLGQKADRHDHCYPTHATIEASPDVLAEGIKVVRVGDAVAPHGGSCSKHPTPHGAKVQKGSASVFANGKPLAREGDPVKCDTGETAPLLEGRPKVLVGDASPVAGAQRSTRDDAAESTTPPQPAAPANPASGGAAGPASLADEIANKPKNFPYEVKQLPTGVVQVGNHILIKPDANRATFQAEILRDLYSIQQYSPGKLLLARLDDPARSSTVTITYLTEQNGHMIPDSPQGAKDPAKGSSSTVQINPAFHFPNSLDPNGTNPSPTHITLFHELTHALHAKEGTLSSTPSWDLWDTWEESNTIRGALLQDSNGNVRFDKTTGEPLRDPINENNYRWEVLKGDKDCAVRTNHRYDVVACPLTRPGGNP